ncbi:MAG: flagellar biosynthetic protein FliR [Actinomycetota bacterium]|nr:flagellar biosynthetic protein FliR [Actinomycetota bacterium]
MISLPAALVLGFVLALVRASAWVVVCPPFSNSSIPAVAKVGLAAGLALLAAPAASRALPGASSAAFVAAVVEQVAIGLAIGFFVKVTVAAVTSAGSLVDLFSGLNLPPSLDPLSQQDVPLVGQLYEMIAVTLLFTSGADLLLVRGFVASFTTRTVVFGSLGELAAGATAQLGSMFAAALEIAAPLVAVLFVTQVLLGLLAKAAPQMNVFVFGFGLQVAVTILGLGLAITALPVELTNLVTRTAGQVFGGG